MTDASPKRHVWLAIAFALAFFATGAMHWLGNSLLGPGLAVVIVAAVLARILGRAPFIPTVIVVGLAVPAAIAARVVVDTAADPTSHNLWPFELFLGGMVGHACAALGALIAIPWVRKSERR